MSFISVSVAMAEVSTCVCVEEKCRRHSKLHLEALSWSCFIVHFSSVVEEDKLFINRNLCNV